LIASFRAETLKSRKRTANWILFGILMLALLLFGYVLTYVILSNPPKNFQSRVPASVLKREVFPENLLPDVLSSMTSLGAAIMIILGGLSTASEYGWLTVQTILLQRPGRLAVLAGKLLQLAIVTFLTSVAILAAAAVTSYVLVTIDGSTSNWPALSELLKGFGALWLQLATWTAFGVFLGIAFRSTAAAIGGGLTYLFVGEALIGQLLRNTQGIKDILRFLPGVNASAVNANFPATFRNPEAATQLVSAGRGAITLVVYLALFALAAAILFQRRDVASG
jgi:ABC-2 type transport system permease protein